jgi:hypothetical protein
MMGLPGQRAQRINGISPLTRPATVRDTPEGDRLSHIRDAVSP